MLTFLWQFTPPAFIGATLVTMLSMFLQSVLPADIKSTLEQVKDVGLTSMLVLGILALWRKLAEKDKTILDLAQSSIAANITIAETNRHLVDEVRRLQPPAR